MRLKKVLAMILVATLSFGTVTMVQAKEKQNSKAKDLTIDTIEEKIENMTIEEKLGQTLMIAPASWNGELVTGKNEEIEAFIKKYNIGGIVLFASNFEKGSKGVVELVDGLQKSSDIPLLVSMDQEGGGVVRILDGTKMVGNMALGAADDKKLTEQVYEAMGNEVKAVGGNVDLAPVSELVEDPFNTIIGLRSFGSNKEKVAEMVKAGVRGLHDSGTMATVKHFPGQASVSQDTHLGMTIIPESKEKVKNDYMYAFKEGIYAGADFVMPTHAAIPSLDDTTFKDKEGNDVPIPTTFSKTILTDILRNEIGFNGVVITDAMDMGAVTENFKDYEISEKALNAGCDMLLMSYPVAGVETNYETGEINDTVKGFDEYLSKIVKDIKDGKVKEERLDEAVRRILTLKVKNNLYEDNKVSLEEKLSNADKVVGSKENKEIEKKAAEKAVTLVKNENNMLPMKLEDDKEVVIYDYKLLGIEIPGYGTQPDISAGLDSIKESIEKIKKENKYDNFKIKTVPIEIKTDIDWSNNKFSISMTKSSEELIKEMDTADYVIIATSFNSYSGKPWYFKDEGCPEAKEVINKLINYANEKNKNYVAINVKEPYGIAYMEKAKSILSIYTNPLDMSMGVDANVEAVIRTIFGYNKPQGKLPVDVKKTKDGKVEYPVGYGLSYN